jgi:hypothetical protein
MTNIFAPPEILSAYAYAEDGSDPDIKRGTHLRVFAGFGASFPITPFAVLKLASGGTDIRLIHVTDRNGIHVNGPEIDLSQIGMGEVTMHSFDNDEQRTVRVDLGNDTDGIRGVQLLDQWNSIIAERNTGPWKFSAPILHKLRVWGTSGNVVVNARMVHINDIVGQHTMLGQPEILGLPVQGMHHWYFGLQDRNNGMERVMEGAPKRLNPMDRPNGPLDEVGPNEEAARVEAMLKSNGLGGGLENMLLNLVDDRTLPPWLQVEKTEDTQETTGKKHFVSASRLDTLQLATLDPGLARFFGFAARFDDLPDFSDPSAWDTLAVAGLFAINPKAFDSKIRQQLLDVDPNDPKEGQLIEKIIESLQVGSGQNISDEVKDIIEKVRTRELLVRAFVTVVSPVSPWLPPSLTKPILMQHQWQTTASNSPSSLYRTSFAFLQPPFTSMSAVAAQIGGGWVSHHDTVNVDGFVPSIRAKPRILGHEQYSGPRRYVMSSRFQTFEPAGLLADQDLPADSGSISYRVWVSDLFGRFGDDPVEFEVGPPSRPLPPPPVLCYHIEPVDIDLDSQQALSPGILKMTVAIPHTSPANRGNMGWDEILTQSFDQDQVTQDRLASAIVVPRIDDLKAGSLHIALMKITLGNDTVGTETKTVDLSVPGFKDVDFTLPKLLPQATMELILSAKFVDTANNESKVSIPERIATLPVRLVDVRPPRVLKTGIGLYWTSAPGPSPEVELKLAWPAQPGARYRVYLTDQNGLGLTQDELSSTCGTEEVLPQPELQPKLLRSCVAVEGCNKVINDGASVKRSMFQLLNNQPIEASSDGRAVLETTLPRSLDAVQFLRIVPLSAEGAEAPFDKCNIVPVAVPESRRPSTPRLDGEVDQATGFASLKITADGFDRKSLEQEEPGLFKPALQGNQPPEYLIRRAVSERDGSDVDSTVPTAPKMADPIYARSILTGQLALQPSEPTTTVFSVKVPDDNSHIKLKQEPFVRYVYWAEVRLPPERRVPAGFTAVDPEVDPEGGVTAVDPANAADHPRPMSIPSAPRVLMYVPQDPPTALLPDAITATRVLPPDHLGNVEVILPITGSPHAHAKAIGPYRLAVWSLWKLPLQPNTPKQAIEPVKIANGVPLEDGTWPSLDDIFDISVSIHLPENVSPTSPLDLRLAIVDPKGRISDITTITVP